MWILPRNHSEYYHFALGMVDSKEELSKLGAELTSSLMWRSKPSPLQTWLVRWNKVSWVPHLFGRMLKPSHHMYFETLLMYLLGATPVNHSRRQEDEKEETTRDTSGLTSEESLARRALDVFSSRTSKGTSHSDLTKYSSTWNTEVTKRRGEYSARLKQALRTRERESSSWATPNTMDYLPQRSEEALRRQATTTRKGRTRPANLREQVNPRAVQIYLEESKKYPTPRASEYKDCGPVGSKSQIHMDKRSYLCAKVKREDMPDGKLNPTWTEWLMGVPTGLTELDFSETE